MAHSVDSSSTRRVVDNSLKTEKIMSAFRSINTGTISTFSRKYAMYQNSTEPATHQHAKAVAAGMIPVFRSKTAITLQPDATNGIASKKRVSCP
jgi:hypothetical protein